RQEIEVERAVVGGVERDQLAARLREQHAVELLEVRGLARERRAVVDELQQDLPAGHVDLDHGVALRAGLARPRELFGRSAAFVKGLRGEGPPAELPTRTPAGISRGRTRAGAPARRPRAWSAGPRPRLRGRRCGSQPPGARGRPPAAARPRAPTATRG